MVLVLLDDKNYLSVIEVLAGIGTWRSQVGYSFLADNRLVVSKFGATYRTYYKEAFVSAVGTINAGAMAGKYHGPISTDPGNKITSLVTVATGTDNEHGFHNQFLGD